MTRRSTKVVPEAVLAILALSLAAGADAQSTVVNNPADPGVVTSYYSICPTATSTTITLPTTITYCPGPNCNGGGPTVTPGPTSPGAGGVHVGEYTTVGPDGETTVYGVYKTVFDHMGPSGIVPATYTITEPCPCHETMPANIMPSGFETTVVPCHVCAATGGPATVTLTQPCPTGPYASQMPAMVSASSAASWSGSGWTSASSAGSGSGMDSGSGYGSGAGAAGCAEGESCPAAPAAPSTGMKNNSTTGTFKAPIESATGAAARQTVAVSSLLGAVAGAVAYMAWLL